MTERRRFKHRTSFNDRLASFAKAAREKAALLAPSLERDDLLRKARQADIAAKLDDWANSPGLKAPD